MNSQNPTISKDDPLRKLILSATRPVSSSQCSLSYLILIQHSICLSQRLAAAFPSSLASTSQRNRRSRGIHGIRTEIDENEVFRLAGLRTPKENAERDLSGGWLLRYVFMDLSARTNGRMIYVKTADNLALSSRLHPVELFLQNGYVLDLSSDPCGWDEDIKHEKPDNPHRVSMPMLNLENIARAIEHASEFAEQKKSGVTDGDRSGSDVASDDFCVSGRTTQPVPIFFDSLYPLIAMHGLGRISMLLHRIRRGRRDTIGKGYFVYQSPIIAPVLEEALSPANHQQLEDYCDAAIMLSGGNIEIVRRSSRANGLGGKLMRELQPFQLRIESSARSRSFCAHGEQFGLVLGLAEQNDDAPSRGKKDIDDSPIYDSEKIMHASQLVSTKESHSAAPQGSSRSRVILQHEEIPRSAATSLLRPSAQQTENETRQGGPRIYIQDDDPEFDDLDEEDPDDDLDL